MPSFDHLEAEWLRTASPPRGRGRVDLVVVREGGGAHSTPARVRVTCEDGVVGDRWAGGKRDPDSQVTLMMTRAAAIVGRGRAPLDRPGDNLLVDLDLSESALPVGSRLRAGTALLEVTAKPHLGCDKFRARFGAEAVAWVNHKSHRARRLRGVNCRVIEAGDVAVGDAIAILSDAPPA